MVYDSFLLSIFPRPVLFAYVRKYVRPGPPLMKESSFSTSSRKESVESSFLKDGSNSFPAVSLTTSTFSVHTVMVLNIESPDLFSTLVQFFCVFLGVGMNSTLLLSDSSSSTAC